VANPTSTTTTPARLTEAEVIDACRLAGRAAASEAEARDTLKGLKADADSLMAKAADALATGTKVSDRKAATEAEVSPPTIGLWRRVGVVVAKGGEKCPGHTTVRTAINAALKATLKLGDIDAAIKPAGSAAEALAAIKALTEGAKTAAAEAAESEVGEEFDPTLTEPASDAQWFAAALDAVRRGFAMDRTLEGVSVLSDLIDAIMVDADSEVPVLSVV